MGGKFDFAYNSKDTDPNADIPYLVTFNHKGLNYITGGVPGGIFMEIHSPSQVGKSYLMYELGMAFINAGGWYYQDDAERAYKRVIGRKIGLEASPRFAKSKERSIQKVFAEQKKFVLGIRKHDKKCPILTAIDSFNFLKTEESMKEIEAELKELENLKKVSIKKVKGYASMKKNNIFSEQLKDYLDFIEKHKVTFLLLNQEKVDYSIMFGDKRVANAEKIVSYDCSLRLRGRAGKKIKHKKLDKIIGRKSIWECIKSRHPDIPPFMKVEVDVIYKKGIKPFSGFADLMVREGVFEACKIGKMNAYSHNDNKFLPKKVAAYVEEHPELMEYVDIE